MRLYVAVISCRNGRDASLARAVAFSPDMEVAGANSSERLLRWYVDRADGALPQAWVLTVSLWVWRGVMLLWALWLAHSLVGWLQWAWRQLSAQGVWKARKREGAAPG